MTCKGPFQTQIILWLYESISPNSIADISQIKGVLLQLTKALQSDSLVASKPVYQSDLRNGPYMHLSSLQKMHILSKVSISYHLAVSCLN